MVLQDMGALSSVYTTLRSWMLCHRTLCIVFAGLLWACFVCVVFSRLERWPRRKPGVCGAFLHTGRRKAGQQRTVFSQRVCGFAPLRFRAFTRFMVRVVRKPSQAMPRSTPDISPTAAAVAFSRIALGLLVAVAMSGQVTGDYVMLPGTDVTVTTILNAQYVSVPLQSMDAPGDDIHYFLSQGYDDCARACASTPGCEVFSVVTATDYWAPVNTCFLKSGIRPGWLEANPNTTLGFSWYAPALYGGDRMMALCEDMNDCMGFSTADGYFRSFGSNNTVNSWISNTTCGAGASAAVVPGSCMTPGSQYITCPHVNATASYGVIASFALPPFLLEKACDTNPKCVGFQATVDQTHGWLLGFSPASVFGVVAIYIPGLPTSANYAVSQPK